RSCPAAGCSVSGVFPAAGGEWDDEHRREPRHGRGRPLSASRPDPVRPAPGRGVPRRHPGARWIAEPRRGLPRAGGKVGVLSGHRVAAITRRLLQGFRRDRRTLALLFVAPIVILGLLGYLMRGSTSAPPVGIANQAGGPLGALVAAALRGSSHITTTDINSAHGAANLKDGPFVAYIVRPRAVSLQSSTGNVAPERH